MQMHNINTGIRDPLHKIQNVKTGIRETLHKIYYIKTGIRDALHKIYNFKTFGRQIQCMQNRELLQSKPRNKR